MKKIIYLTAFTLLGILLQFLIHALVEVWYIGLLTANFAKYSLGFSWAQWYAIHHALSLLLLVAGAGFGFWQGRYWWRQIYVLKRWQKLTRVK